MNQELREDLIRLIEALIPTIDDDYRCSDDPDDGMPGTGLTVGTGDSMLTWSYQTGDNSFTGGAYGYPHWAVVSIYRDSEPAELADEIISQWHDMINI